MAQNVLNVEFSPCQPAPADGYVIRYRVLGSETEYRTAGPFTESPAQVIDNSDPAGTSYEGFIQGDCGGGKMGVSVPFVAEFTGSIVAPSSEAPSSGGGSSMAPSSEGPNPPIDGFIEVTGCAEEYAITAVRESGNNFVGPFPINSGTGPQPSAYPAGTYNVAVTVVAGGGATNAHLTGIDSEGNVFCQNITGGVIHNMPGFIISDAGEWSIRLDCGDCP